MVKMFRRRDASEVKNACIGVLGYIDRGHSPRQKQRQSKGQVGLSSSIRA